MASWAEVHRIADNLPHAVTSTRRGLRWWRVADKLFVWERPLRAKEALELGEQAPAGAILAARVEHEIAKQALLADDPGVFFTTSHFARSATILVRLDEIGDAELEEVIVEAWLVRAPSRLAESYVREHRSTDPSA